MNMEAPTAPTLEKAKVEGGEIKVEMWELVEAIRVKKKLEEYLSIVEELSEVLTEKNEEIWNELENVESKVESKELLRKLDIELNLEANVEALKRHLRYYINEINEQIKEMLDEKIEEIYKESQNIKEESDRFDFVYEKTFELVSIILDEIEKDVKVESKKLDELIYKLVNPEDSITWDAFHIYDRVVENLKKFGIEFE
jgi:hypothetical protein